ncbi:hypothetical protein NSK_008656 [Nannochloropsis salina CCMP1776]|uniref:Wbp11/ELF5/Saf1 N-terminal domain-containing protein n=1 Tax=Nannochloropsis salina CCMP1776 TaxID=1027361 RepID=A0A4D9CTP8_9STRA|nr:hypothetical protein NSK_008656 [Nannochloropsis salina CCMP1776]|eukprot:TFJ80099.1 hypothetical protein NSK_008656 [Nannochloropsis salina CCMP1776]
MGRNTKSGKREMNPADAYRKEQRKKEIKKNKKDRKRVRELGSYVKDPEVLKEEIDKMDKLSAAGTLDHKLVGKLEQMKHLYPAIVKLHAKKKSMLARGGAVDDEELEAMLDEAESASQRQSHPSNAAASTDAYRPALTSLEMPPRGLPPPPLPGPPPHLQHIYGGGAAVPFAGPTSYGRPPPPPPTRLPRPPFARPAPPPPAPPPVLPHGLPPHLAAARAHAIADPLDPSGANYGEYRRASYVEHHRGLPRGPGSLPAAMPTVMGPSMPPPGPALAPSPPPASAPSAQPAGPALGPVMGPSKPARVDKDLVSFMPASLRVKRPAPPSVTASMRPRCLSGPVGPRTEGQGGTGRSKTPAKPKAAQDSYDEFMSELSGLL